MFCVGVCVLVGVCVAVLVFPCLFVLCNRRFVRSCLCWFCVGVVGSVLFVFE